MTGRVVSITRHVGLADVRPDTTVRLDAIARILQDAADADSASAAVPGIGVWILRRVALDIAHTPRFRADVDARTWCSGVGPRWAERTTELYVDARRCVTATAVWVHVDPDRGTPMRLPPAFAEVWGVGDPTRRIRATLVHAGPRNASSGRPWPLRATDIDVIGHVNNAAYWAAVEDELARRYHPRVTAAEIEFGAGLGPGDDVTFVVEDRPDGFASWCVADGAVRASMLVRLRS